MVDAGRVRLAELEAPTDAVPTDPMRAAAAFARAVSPKPGAKDEPIGTPARIR